MIVNYLFKTKEHKNYLKLQLCFQTIFVNSKSNQNMIDNTSPTTVTGSDSDRMIPSAGSRLLLTESFCN